MAEPEGPLAGSGSPRRRDQDLPLARRIGSWLVWWIVLMVFWVWLDDSTDTAELAVGAAVAAMGAMLAELVQHQSATHFRFSVEWVVPALRLPKQIVQDHVIIGRALWRYVVHAEAPPSAFETIPTDWGDEDALGVTRRALVLGGASVSPNTVALGIDADRDVMVVHRLVASDAGRRPSKRT